MTESNHRSSSFASNIETIISSSSSSFSTKKKQQAHIASINSTLIASEKKNNEFHALFKSIPAEELLVDGSLLQFGIFCYFICLLGYSCAIQKDILLQGRLYLSEQHISFYSNIFGYVTTIIIPLAEIVAIEKKLTAFVIPNAISISTLHSKYFFASLMYRDNAFNKICTVWKNAISLNPLPIAVALGASLDDTSLFTSTTSTSLQQQQGTLKSIFSSDNLFQPQQQHHKNSIENEPFNVSELDQQSISSAEIIPGLMSCGCRSHSGRIFLELPALKTPFKTILKILYDNFEISTEQKSLKSSSKASSQQQHSGDSLPDFWKLTRKATDIRVSEWKSPPASIQPEFIAERKTSFYIPFKSIGLFSNKNVYCILNEKLLVKHKKRVIVSCTVSYPELPGGTHIEIALKYCIYKIEDQKTCLTVSGDIRLTDSIWLIDSVRKLLFSEQESYFQDLGAFLSVSKIIPNQEKRDFKKDISLFNILIAVVAFILSVIVVLQLKENITYKLSLLSFFQHQTKSSSSASVSQPKEEEAKHSSIDRILSEIAHKKLKEIEYETKEIQQKILQFRRRDH